MRWILLLLLIACTIEPENPMDSMPCHQMPDGSWMGQCDFDTIETNSLVQESQSVDTSFDLVAAPAQWQLGDIEVNGYAYNNMLPGPMIMAEKNDEMTVSFTNMLDEPTTVHWHGLRHQIQYDGVPGMTQDEVQPGDTFEYQLQFPDEGLFWYHPHVRDDRQIDLGLYGLIRVGTSAYPEHYIVLDDIFVEQGRPFGHGRKEANFALMGRYGTHYVVNGAERYTATVEGTQRLYFVNTANARPFRISVPGALIRAAGGDIGDYAYQNFVDEIILGPSERVSVDVWFPEAGEYSIVHRGEDEHVLGTLSVTSTDDIIVPTQGDTDVLDYVKYGGDPEYTLSLTVNLSGYDMPCHKMGDIWMGDCDPELLEGNDDHEVHDIEWEDDMVMMNLMSTTSMVEWQIVDQDGNVNMDVVLDSKVGDKLTVRLQNEIDSEHPMQHPIHLHGQRFLVLNENGVVPENYGWEDTVIVPAGQYVDILIDVTNPGMWMIHCHIAEHAESGMMSWLNVRSDG